MILCRWPLVCCLWSWMAFVCLLPPQGAAQNPTLANATRFSDGMCWVQFSPNQRWRLVGPDGRVVNKLKIWPQELQDPSQGLTPIKFKDKWGYINREGKWAIEPIYELVGPFSEGLAWVFMEGRFSYINQTGTRVVPNIYFGANDFSEGFAAVWNDSTWGFVDRQGRLGIPALFMSVRNFRRGLCAASDGTSWGYINTEGRWVVPPRFSFVAEFGEEGLAIASKFVADSAWQADSIFRRVDRQAVETQAAQAHADTGSLEALASSAALPRFYYEFVRMDTVKKVYIAADTLLGFVGKDGNFAFAAKYRGLRPFGMGLAGFRTDSLWGFIDTEGRVAIPPAFQAVTEFSGGLAAVQQNSRWGYISRQGQWVVQPTYDSAEPFHENLARVEKGGRVGFINPQGVLVVGR